MNRRQALAAIAGACAASLLAPLTAWAGDAPTTTTTATATMKCPANYRVNSGACRMAKQTNRCPEQHGQKCQGKK